MQTPPRPRRRPTRAIAIILAVALVASVSGCSATPPTPQFSGPIGVNDGFIETGGSVSPFADELPAIALLDPALRRAMQDAATAAIAEGFEFVVTSGWRSERYQQQLFDDAVLNYGSADEARRWVAPADVSSHVSGHAVDIGFTDANSWLSQHGAEYGLCQTYANEMWHFELATTPGGVCPAQLTDPSEDPGRARR